VTSNPLEELTLAQLQARTSMKWRGHPADVLPLWVAEMDVKLAPTVADAIHRAVDVGDTGYPYGTALAEAVSEFASRRWQWHDLQVSRTAIVPDVMLGIVEMLRLVTDPGDTVIVNPPVYPPFFAFVSHDGRQLLYAPLTRDGRIDLDVLEEAFSRARGSAGPDGKVAYLLCNPHNPTGTVHTADELRGVAERARRFRVRVVSDEIHAPLVYSEARFIPYLSIPGAENALTLMSATKAWNLCGLKAAIAIAGPDSVADLRRMPDEVSHGPSHVGAIAHAAAFATAGDWLDDLLQGLDANRRLLGDLIAEHLPEVKYQRPQGTYLAWLDCRQLGLDAAGGAASQGLGVVSDLSGPAHWFREHAQVALTSGHIFGTGGVGHVRVNFATSTAILVEAASRMARALRDAR
jgi:cystathionine beta-lyase